MSNIEYSDFHKFRVSLGVALITLAVLIPWLFLREPFDLLVPVKTIDTLTPEAQSVLSLRQSTLFKIISLLPYISAGLAISGVVSLASGSVRWKKSQELADQSSALGVEKQRKELKAMNPDETRQKIFAEIKDSETQTSEEGQSTNSDSSVSQPSISAVERYSKIEKVITSKLIDCFGDEYKVLTNQRIDGAEFDNVLQRRQGATDIIAEVRYSPTGYSYPKIKNQLEQLIQSSEKYEKSTERKAIALMLLIAPQASSIEQSLLTQYQNYIAKEMENSDSLFLWYFLVEEDLESFNCNDLRRDTAMTRQFVDSSNLRSVDYDKDTKILEVEFTNGNIYHYYDVPHRAYLELLSAPSHGKYLAAYIKGLYRYKQVR